MASRLIVIEWTSALMVAAAPAPAQPPPPGAIVRWGGPGSWTVFDPGPFVQVSAGPNIIVGLRPDRSAVAWYLGFAHERPGPFRHVEGAGPSEGRAFGVLEGGSVMAWPNQPSGPPPAGPFVEAIGDGWGAILLRDDGTLSSWGPLAAWPLPADPFLAVDAGLLTGVGVRFDGTLKAWGQGTANFPAPPVGTFVSVSVEYGLGRHALARRADGTLVAWGSSQHVVPAPPIGTFKAAEVGDCRPSQTDPLWGLGIRTDDTLATWGPAPPGVGDVPPGKYTSVGSGWDYAIALVGCYADCNDDGAATVSDFGCYQTRFVSASAYADCTGDGALTVADFGCFQTQFALGCP